MTHTSKRGPFRSRSHITADLLRSLAAVAAQAHEDFFVRRPRNVYRRRFIAAALCQGAALHYIGLGTGVKDLDIHLFYLQHHRQKQVARARKVRWIKAKGFGSRRVDILRTVVPPRALSRQSQNPIKVLREYLSARPTNTGRRLAEKPVIGLIPRRIFGRVIWPKPRPTP